jgi:hypothetical protein
MSSGRIIMEYRHGSNVSRVERPALEENYWRDPRREEVAAAIRAAAEELILASVGPVDKPSDVG